VQPTDAKTDQAALFGVALTAILAVIIANGAWEPFSVVVGLVLIAVLVGYYRPTAPRGADAWAKAITFSAVASLCAVIFAAYFVFLLIRLKSGGTCPIQAIHDETVDECLSRITTSYALPPLWLVANGVMLLLWFRWIRPALPEPRDDVGGPG
jgi:hypothetical protein